MCRPSLDCRFVKVYFHQRRVILITFTKLQFVTFTGKQTVIMGNINQIQQIFISFSVGRIIT